MTSARSLLTTQLCIVISSLHGLQLLSVGCLADDQVQGAPQEFRSENEFPVLRWEDEKPGSEIETLQLLMNSTKSNYQKIRTWEGTYAVLINERLPRDFVAEISNNAHEVPLIRELKFLMTFVVDVEADAIRRSRSKVTSAFMELQSRKTIDLPATGSAEGSDVVTPEHYISYDPQSLWAGFSEAPDHPELSNVQAAIRQSPDLVDSMHYGDLIEPRNFFGVGSAKQKSWDILQNTNDCLEGKHGAEGTRWVHESMAIERASGPGGVWYRVTMLYDKAKTRIVSIWSPLAGYNLVKYNVTTFDQNGEQRRGSAISTEWQQVEGIYIPARVVESLHRPENGEQSLFRKLVMKQCSINTPVEPSQFTYAALGMKDGDVVKDTIEKAFYVIRDAQPVKLADFGEQDTQQLAPAVKFSSVGRLAGIALAIALVLVLTALILWKQAKQSDS